MAGGVRPGRFPAAVKLLVSTTFRNTSSWLSSGRAVRAAPARNRSPAIHRNFAEFSDSATHQPGPGGRLLGDIALECFSLVGSQRIRGGEMTRRRPIKQQRRALSFHIEIGRAHV